MPTSPTGAGPEDSLRDTAIEWFVRMRGPDAERLRPEFEAWLAASTNHRRMYDRIALRWDQSGLVGHTPSGQAREGLPPRPRKKVPAWPYAIAACIAALVVIGVLVSQRGSGADIVGAPQEIASAIGIRTVRLDDGSTVILDAGARLVQRFSGAERRILLEAGKARFEVAHNATRPFIVMAGGREVVATGTVFDVAIVAGGVEVALLRGGVDVRVVPAARVQARVLAHLNPGQSVAIAEAAQQVAPEASDPTALSWPSGLVDFDGTPLREVIATANRYAKRKIVLDDPALGALQVTGGFKMGDPDGLAASLAAAFHLQVRSATDGSLHLARSER